MMKHRNYKLEKIAEIFRITSPITPQFPLDITCLERMIMFSEPISIIKLQTLTLEEIAQYFEFRGMSLCNPLDRKKLHGFVLSRRQNTYIFLNGTDTVSEQCFTLAHEFSHYLLDLKLPRTRLIEAFGPSVKDALDFKRPFTSAERIKAIVSGMPLDNYYHRLESNQLHGSDRHLLWRCEAAADYLAFELLAPFKIILKDIAAKFESKRPTYNELTEFLPEYLEARFALPKAAMFQYEKYIKDLVSGGQSLREKWRI